MWPWGLGPPRPPWPPAGPAIRVPRIPWGVCGSAGPPCGPEGGCPQAGQGSRLVLATLLREGSELSTCDKSSSLKKWHFAFVICDRPCDMLPLPTLDCAGAGSGLQAARGWMGRYRPQCARCSSGAGIRRRGVAHAALPPRAVPEMCQSQSHAAAGITASIKAPPFMFIRSPPSRSNPLPSLFSPNLPFGPTIWCAASRSQPPRLLQPPSSPTPWLLCPTPAPLRLWRSSEQASRSRSIHQLRRRRLAQLCTRLVRTTYCPPPPRPRPSLSSR